MPRATRQGHREWALPLLGPKGGVSGVLRGRSLLATLKHTSGTRVQESGGRVTQAAR